MTFLPDGHVAVAP
ncbi:hypothetical protein ECPA4_5758, partial [Escherichia coli PA4]